ncbi:MAG: glycosyltransferase [Candidatus Eisenbacteria bacterium]
MTYAGRFEAGQGVENLLRVASRSGKGFRLRVIGLAEGDRALREKLASLSGGSADLLPRTGQAGLVPLLAESDLLLLPREKNGATEVAMPTKFAEYLAVGRPVLLTRVGEPAVLAERHRCGLVVEGGGEALVEGILRFAALPPGERRAMGERARELAEREFSWDAIGAGYASFLRAIAGEGGSR